MTVLAFALGVLSAGVACHPVDSERIEARHLAAVYPEFAALPAGQFIAFAPLPGQTRTLGPEELARIANGGRLPSENWGSVCFEWPMNPLSPERTIAAMRAALHLPEASIEILDRDPRPVPSGNVVFTFQGLSPAPAAGGDGAALWRGSVQYAKERSWNTWARVRVKASQQRVVAVTALPPGVPIGKDAVRVETVEGWPAPGITGVGLEEVVGREPRRPIAAGMPIALDTLQIPKEVKKGDVVRVIVSSGSARLLLEGRAETEGARGEWIAVKNPASTKTFRAQVKEKGVAAVVVSQ